MKKIYRILLLVLVFAFVLSVFVACDKNDNSKCKDRHNWLNGVCTVCEAKYEFVDYTSDLKLDMDSKTAKYTSSNLLRLFVDGDTTHFNVPTSIDAEGVFKARYLAVNTPESTGQVEPYGKLASDFTHETLQKAVDNGGSVLLESDTDDGLWNADSYGRFLSWVWYQPSKGADYRNLNLELLQNGYGYGSHPGGNRYGEACVAALAQAIDAKLIVHSNLKDPDFYYGKAIEIVLKELRTHFTKYEGKVVAFEGIVAKYCNNSSYVQWFCEEDNMYYGIPVYYNGSDTDIKTALAVGSKVRVVGNVSQFNEMWQVSGITYNAYNLNDPKNTTLLQANCDISIREITIEEFFSNKTVSVYDYEAEADKDVTYKLSELIMGTTVTMKNLEVIDVYTTDSGSSKGAISLTCKVGDKEITVRTEKLYKDDGDGGFILATEDEFMGQIIDVEGIVDHFTLNSHDEYQIRVVSYDDIVIHP